MFCRLFGEDIKKVIFVLRTQNGSLLIKLLLAVRRAVEHGNLTRKAMAIFARITYNIFQAALKIIFKLN